MENSIFEKNRVTAFTDAVFSVAMTLLILEVTIPAYADVKSSGSLNALLERTPNFIGFVLSFMVTAFYWIDYMRITKYISNFDMRALWLNICMLFLIVLLPFSTAFYVNSVLLKGPFLFYSLNLGSIAFLQLLLISYIHKKELGKTGLTELKSKWLFTRSLNTFLVWILAGIIGLFSPVVAKFLFIFIFVIEPFIDSYYKKKSTTK